MKVIGSATAATLREFERRGYQPQQTVNAIIAEARRRYPDATAIFVEAVTHDGFDIVAV